MKEYSDDLIEEIKENIDIVDFIGEYVDLTRKGKEYFGKCPLHDERTGSFSVTPSKICITALVVKGWRCNYFLPGTFEYDI